MSKFCSENNIILIALYPNATHILQPLDVALFRTFRAAYQRSFQSLCENSGTLSIRKSQVAHVLKNAFERLGLKTILANGFKTCGLHPLNVNAIDFTKVFKRNGNSSYETQITSEDASEVPTISHSLIVLESLIDTDTLRSFKIHNGSIWEGRKEDESLYNIWYKLEKPMNTTNLTVDNEVIHNQGVSILYSNSITYK